MILRPMTRSFVALTLLVWLAGCATGEDVRSTKPSSLIVPKQSYEVMALCALEALDGYVNAGVTFGGGRYVDYRPQQRARITGFESRSSGMRPTWEVDLQQVGPDVKIQVYNRSIVELHVLDGCTGTATWVETK